MNKRNKEFTISILGAGSWGGTIAWLLSNKGYKINLWTFSYEEYNQLKSSKSLLRPKKINLNKNIYLTTDLNLVAKKSDLIIFAIPASVFKSTATKLKKLKPPKSTIFLSATKGITKHDSGRPSTILKKIFPSNPTAILSGPNIALDVISKSPVISVIASKNIKTAKLLQEILSTKHFRIYINNDINGVEVAGALKNVIAIAAGMCDGFGFNISSKAALISRGLIEIGRIALKEGGKLKTLLSAAAIGDLVATSCSTNSRNYKVGFAISKGKKLKAILKDLGQVAEGVETVKAAYELSRKHKIYAPITNAVYNVVIQNKRPKSELRKLLDTPLKSQLEI